MSTVIIDRKCVKIVYGLVVLLFLTKCVNSSRKPTNPPKQTTKHPVYTTAKQFQIVTTAKHTTTVAATTKKLKPSDSEELLTIVEDQSKVPPPPVNPSNHDPCVLGSAELYLSWWINSDGTLAVPDEIAELKLDFAYTTIINSTTLIDRIRQNNEDNHFLSEPEIVFMSIAHSNLTNIPNDALELVGDTLEYLSLSGNDFSELESQSSSNESSNDIRTSNETPLFRQLYQLKELDMRHCNIHSLREGSFDHLDNLQKLFLSNNYIDEISTTVFQNIPNLVHLDLSHNTVDENTMSRDALAKTFEGIKFNQDFQFSHLKKLLFLDVSHSKVSILSTPTFTSMPPSLRMLSLCYTTISHIPDGMFANSNLQVLDLSGNPSLAYYSQGGSLSNLSHSLEVLSMEDSMIKSLGLICKLSNLKILQLEGNNINQINNNTFDGLRSLEMLDLSSNHLSNWYSRVFENNPNLKLMKLRNNNINLMTQAMYEDFLALRYLALGNNDFICNCLMREFMDLAISNSRQPNCTSFENELPTVSDTLNEIVATGYEAMFNQNYNFTYNIRHRILEEYLATVDSSYENILNTKKKYIKYNLEIYQSPTIHTRRWLRREDYHVKRNTNNRKKSLNAGLNFSFQLLDFMESNYQCINSTSNEQRNLTDIDNCDITDRSTPMEGITNVSKNLIILLGTFLFILIMFLVIYYKWWYVRYFFVIVKNAAILSYLDKDKIKQTPIEGDDEAFTYDVFVSYCDENRDWIIEELLPNIEHRRDIKICLHERDFQVGLSILENIISCMDRARCLLLIVSQSFLLSQWCQFEMHLAQHRLIETRREQLILILLEDVPKRRRPKTLHYLMKTKTYIKWPSNESSSDPYSRSDKVDLHIIEERKVFWKRLKKALMPYDFEDGRN